MKIYLNGNHTVNDRKVRYSDVIDVYFENFYGDEDLTYLTSSFEEHVFANFDYEGKDLYFHFVNLFVKSKKRFIGIEDRLDKERRLKETEMENSFWTRNFDKKEENHENLIQLLGSDENR